jgi:hypothetical protein
LKIRPIFLPGIIAALSLAAAASASEPLRPPRIEARSTDLLAVGTVHGDRMTIHLSRILDNAPVRDAVVTVALRGATHSTTAETDGSYTLQTPDLSLPGAVSVQFQVARGGAREEFNGSLRIDVAAGGTQEKDNSRQLWWWVLNFAVCIGFLVLWSRRRKTARS